MTEEISERERSDGEEEEDKYERIPFSRIKKSAFKFSKWGEIENINEIIRLEKQDLTKNEEKIITKMTEKSKSICFSNFHRQYAGENKLKIRGDLQCENTPLCDHAKRRFRKKQKKTPPVNTYAICTRSKSKKRKKEKIHAKILFKQSL